MIDVRVRGNGGDVEYMIKMNAGDTVVYSWEVLGVADPQAFLTEFHGHTEPVGGRRLDVRESENRFPVDNTCNPIDAPIPPSESISLR